MSVYTLQDTVGAAVLLALYLSLTPDVLPRVQAIPGISPFSLEWPRYLISLLSHKSAPPAHDWPSTVINVKSGYSRTNRSAAIEHLLQSHSGKPTSRGLTLTFLYTSRFPGMPTGDVVGWSAAVTAAAQVAVAWVLQHKGIASDNVLPIVISGIGLSFVGGLIVLFRHTDGLRTARSVPPHRREVVCITNGNGSTDAVVVATEAGGAKLEDIAGGRSGPLNVTYSAAVTVLLMLWAAVFVRLTSLHVADAWCVLGLGALGAVHTMYAARTWRGAAALGFKFEDARKMIVHDDKVMQALMRAEEIESGVGSALLPVFFPGPLRPKEEEWWHARKDAAKSV